MAKSDRPTDPYATTPYKSGAGGAMVRIAIVGILLAGAAWGYFTFGRNEQVAEVPLEPPAAQQQFADAGALPESEPLETAAAPEPTPAPTPAPRATRVRPEPAPEPTPEPAPVAPPAVTPLPPIEPTPDPLSPTEPM